MVRWRAATCQALGAARRVRFACLFISHDLALVHEISDRVAVLREGKVIEGGPVATVFANPRQEYTRNLISAVPAADPSAAACVPAPHGCP